MLCFARCCWCVSSCACVSVQGPPFNATQFGKYLGNDYYCKTPKPQYKELPGVPRTPPKVKFTHKVANMAKKAMAFVKGGLKKLFGAFKRKR